MQVQGQYRYKRSGSELPVPEASNSKYGREAIHLASAVDPMLSDTVEDRNATEG